VFQFVREQAIPFDFVWGVAVRIEDDVIRESVRMRADRARGFGSVVIVMDTHAAEVGHHLEFVEGPSDRIQRLTSRT
jgi:hypothetical protein